MAFALEPVVGSLQFDTSGFAHGFMESEVLMHAFPTIVTDFMVEPWIAALDVIKEAGSFIVETVEQMASTYHEMGLAAERAGVGVEAFSQIAAATKVAGIGTEELGMAFKFLEDRAANASRGDKEAVKAFEQIGISAQEVSGMLNDPIALFERVHEAIYSLESPSLRVAAVTDLMSRAGYKMISVFAESPAEMQAFKQTLESLHGTVSESEERMGLSFGKLEAVFGAAWTGIKKSIADPILGYLSKHFEEIVEGAMSLAAVIRGGVGGAFEVLGPIVKGVWHFLEGLGSLVASVLVPVMQILAPILEAVGAFLGIIATAIGSLASTVGGVVSSLTGLVGLGLNPSTSAAAAAAGSGDTNVNIEKIQLPDIDVHEASSQLAAKMEPHIRENYERQRREWESAAQHDRVRRTIRGR